MRGEHRFLREQDERTWFGFVAVEAEPADAVAVRWGRVNALGRAQFGHAIEDGIAAALDAHAARDDGWPFALTIVDVRFALEQSDAGSMQCAAALAAWKALGHDETATRCHLADDGWRVLFAI